ncbi:MAG: phytanoyl-CoA dioxygenase family protein, partial [Planctomycetota bacterium]|nr:phytanoyl-CoA dioxygenase family protein [Planctomycetota bacterium]
MSTTTTAKVFTPDQVHHYQEQGYLLPQRQLLPAADYAALSATTESLVASWAAAGGRTEHMDVPHFYHPELFRFLLHDAVLDVVEDLIGPDIALFSNHFICKPTGDGRRVPWHEDSAYWKGMWDPMEVVTVWLAIDPSTLSNGCMKVIPGSHAGGYSAYHDVAVDDPSVFATEISAGQFDSDTAVACELAPGEYSLHHARCIHGSAANTSSQRRCGYIMRYCSTASRFDGSSTGRDGLHQIYLARGRDRAGNNYGEAGTVNRAWV